MKIYLEIQEKLTPFVNMCKDDFKNKKQKVIKQNKALPFI